jgi:hypothetical protein
MRTPGASPKIEMQSLSRSGQKLKDKKEAIAALRTKREANEATERRRITEKLPLLFSPDKYRHQKDTRSAERVLHHDVQEKPNAMECTMQLFKGEAPEAVADVSTPLRPREGKLEDAIRKQKVIRHTKGIENEPVIQDALEKLFIWDELDGKAFRRLSLEGITIRDLESHRNSIDAKMGCDQQIQPQLAGEGSSPTSSIRSALALFDASGPVPYKRVTSGAMGSMTPSAGLECTATPDHGCRRDPPHSASAANRRSVSNNTAATFSVVKALKQYLQSRHAELLVRSSPGTSTAVNTPSSSVLSSRSRGYHDISVQEVLQLLPGAAALDSAGGAPLSARSGDTAPQTPLSDLSTLSISSSVQSRSGGLFFGGSAKMRSGDLTSSAKSNLGNCSKNFMFKSKTSESFKKSLSSCGSENLSPNECGPVGGSGKKPLAPLRRAAGPSPLQLQLGSPLAEQRGPEGDAVITTADPGHIMPKSLTGEISDEIQVSNQLSPELVVSLDGTDISAIIESRSDSNQNGEYLSSLEKCEFELSVSSGFSNKNLLDDHLYTPVNKMKALSPTSDLDSASAESVWRDVPCSESDSSLQRSPYTDTAIDDSSHQEVHTTDLYSIVNEASLQGLIFCNVAGYVDKKYSVEYLIEIQVCTVKISVKFTH